MVLVYTFFKPYISKICNDFSLYIHYNLIEFRFLVFTPNNSHFTKIKKLNEHVTKNWTPIET